MYTTTIRTRARTRRNIRALRALRGRLPMHARARHASRVPRHMLRAMRCALYARRPLGGGPYGFWAHAAATWRAAAASAAYTALTGHPYRR